MHPTPIICGHHADMDTCPKCAENWRESCRLLDGLCACGQPTGSRAIDRCEACERADWRFRETLEYVHALAVDSHARARMDALGAQEGGRG